VGHLLTEHFVNPQFTGTAFSGSFDLWIKLRNRIVGGKAVPRHIGRSRPGHDRVQFTVRRSQRGIQEGGAGRRRWRLDVGQHEQSRAENTFYRYKGAFGCRLKARRQAAQRKEIHRLQHSQPVR